MSTTDGSGALEYDEEARVVQIYPRVSYDTAAYCPLQISVGDTVALVIHNAVVTLDLDPNQAYDLLEVRKSGGKERPLEAGDSPLERVLLWPREVQKWHPQSKGYYFILQQQQVNNGGCRTEICTGECDDLCSLSTLTEENVLEVLRQRFYKHKIYTYANKILIAINPNKFLPVYYNPMYVKMYENQPLGKLSPHIFAIADVTFRAMLNRQANQCIVITGESGSGKTESSSYLIHCLTSLSQNMYSSGLERTILGSGPVLEAFGNAKTTKNNNSSRFGKFIQLNYLESGVIRGAVIEKYLLEKCRVVTRDKSERNFHVFYYLLMGASKDEQEELHLLKPQDYLYLKQEDLLLDDQEKLGQEYKRLHQAMEMVGFLPSTKKHIFSILSAILHLGNVTFTQSDDPPRLEVGPPEVLSILSDLLKVEEESLVNTLIKRKMITASFTIALPYTLDEAVAMRDSMAQSLYGALFDWIILHINHATMNRRDMEESISCLSIGVLDMFGFENLQSNSFEQLCINYANETLQCYINHNIFRLEQEEFVEEGIVWKNIEFSDNSDCVQLFDKKSIGLFDLLEKESNLTEATDKSLLVKIKKQHQDNPYFKPSPHTEPTFVIQHFAGRVKYHIKDFRKKNTEHMRPDVISLLRSSERSFIHHLVASSPEAQFRWGVLRAAIRILTVFKNLGRRREELSKYNTQVHEWRTKSGRQKQIIPKVKPHNSWMLTDSLSIVFDFVLESGSSQLYLCFIKQNLVDLRSLRHIIGLTGHDLTSKSIFHPHRKSNPSTVGSQFQASLTTLMDRIAKAEPFFIFCVRANAEKKELCFDDKLVLNQIRYTGLLQIVHIQKSGYSAKYTFEEFVEKFRILFPQGTAATPAHITALFEWMALDKKTYQIGKTKVFLKEKQRQLLQDTLNKEVMRRIITLQRWFRTCLIRFHFLHKRDATMIIQVQHFCLFKSNLIVMLLLILLSVLLLPTVTFSKHTSHSNQTTNQNSAKSNRNPTIRISRATRGLQWDSSLDQEVTDSKELRNLDEFLGNQDLSPAETIFLTATMQFRENIKDMYSVQPQIHYKDLMKGFHNKVNTLAGATEKGEVPMVVNLFQSVLDGFIRATKKRAASEPAKVNFIAFGRSSVLDSPLDHLFSTYQVNIMQSCDLCGSYIWGMEKAYMCSACKLICHKKCLSKIITDCSTRSSAHFGVQVCALTSKANPVPIVMETLLMHVELNGLYTEGIYRKSGSACRAKELHQVLQKNPETVCLDNYPIHTITGLIKRWLRELPDPLMTFSLYHDFLHAVELPEEEERIKAVYQKLEELPPANFSTLERLIFHLVRVAKDEEHNKMSPSALAIVFAPCILRSPDSDDPLLCMKDVPRTTLCVEILITEQFRRYNEKMQNIQELEHAEAMAVNQLRLRRQATVRGRYKGRAEQMRHQTAFV
uniref:Myosin IXb n=1 Tax=Astatotilapia calliptera TaxID=8154 RepID=A0A3P8PH03_ASTCA